MRHSILVMPALVRGIHALGTRADKDVDGRGRAAHARATPRHR